MSQELLLGNRGQQDLIRVRTDMHLLVLHHIQKLAALLSAHRLAYAHQAIHPQCLRQLCQLVKEALTAAELSAWKDAIPYSTLEAVRVSQLSSVFLRACRACCVDHQLLISHRSEVCKDKSVHQRETDTYLGPGACVDASQEDPPGSLGPATGELEP